MPSDRKPSLILPVAVVVILLLAGYVGAYYWMVEPIDFGAFKWDLYSPSGEMPPGGYDPDSRWGRFFRPMNWIDRRIRPKVWGTATAPWEPD